VDGDDAGRFLARAVTGGVLGGLLAAAWSALASTGAGLPWWSALALYSTRLWGLAPQPIVAAGLGGAVLAGVTWLLGLGLAAGAMFGLLAGALAPHQLSRRALAVLGAGFGLTLFILAASARTALLSPAFAAELPGWARAVGLALIGAAAGDAAGRDLRA